jgi:hypothetical protein
MRSLTGVIHASLLTAVWAAGCAQPQRDPSSMKPPERPRELDLLAGWVGNWKDAGELKSCDGRITQTKGTHEVAWDLDKRILVERMTTDMGAMGKVNGLAIYSYNPREKQFEYQFYGNNGETSSGDMTYSEKKKDWTLRVRSHNPFTGQPTVGEGKFTMPDPNTIEWAWKEWDALKLQKHVDGKGIVKRE